MPKRRRTDPEPELEDVHSGDGGAAVTVVGTEDEPAEVKSEEFAPAEVTRCEGLWFDDGNIVLQVEDVQFKVYRAILAQRSPVLAGMFERSEAEAGQSVDGWPVVHLQNDSAEDVEYMLLALYGDPTYTNVRKASPFPVIAAMIRLGKKYKIDYLRDEGLLRLKLEFPTKFEDFEKISQVDPYTHIRCEDDRAEKDMELKLVNLSEECGIQTILPALYYQVVLNMEDALSAGQLSGETTYSLIYGRDQLLSARLTKVFHWVCEVGEIEGCTSRKKCASISHSLLKALFKKPQPLDLADALSYHWTVLVKELQIPKGSLYGGLEWHGQISIFDFSFDVCEQGPASCPALGSGVRAGSPPPPSSLRRLNQ